MKAATFFTHEEKNKIKETTQDIESRTDGEIAVMVVDRAIVTWKRRSLGDLFSEVSFPW